MPQDDESEAQRLAQMQGLGESNYMTTEDIKHYAIQDFGFTGGNPFEDVNHDVSR